MTAWSLDPMDITKCCFFPKDALLGHTTAASSSCSLFVGLSVFSFVFSNWNYNYSLQNSWVAFAVSLFIYGNVISFAALQYF